MAIDTTPLETAYSALISDTFDAGSIDSELAKIELANYLAAIQTYSGGISDNVQSWSIAGKTFTFRDMKSLRHPDFYRESLDALLGRNSTTSGGYLVTLGGLHR